MKRFFFWFTLASGVTAAVLMARRGESFGNIAKKAIGNPVGTLGTELKNAFSGQPGQKALQA